MSLSIAVWSSEDRREVLALWLRCFGDSARDLDRALAAPGCAVFVAREDGAFAMGCMAGSMASP
jgi:hypothetical protein